MGRAQHLEPEPEPRAALGPVPGPGAGSPGLGPRLQGPCQAPVSALLATYVCAYSTLIYAISIRKTTNYSK